MTRGRRPPPPIALVDPEGALALDPADQGDMASDLPLHPPAHLSSAVRIRSAKYALGDIVRHRVFPFRGVVFDVDPVFNNTEEWYQAIPAHVRPSKDQPFYHLLARNADATYQAYVSEQNLLSDADAGPVAHPMIDELFDGLSHGRYRLRSRAMM